MKWTYIFFSIFIVTSCTKPTSINYYDANKSVIINSDSKPLIDSQLNALNIIPNKTDEINIYSTINSAATEEIGDSLRKYYEDIYSTLISLDSTNKNYFDSLNTRNQLFETAIVIHNNNTGEVVVNSSYPKETNQVARKEAIGSLSRIFLYAYAMDKEYTPSDSVPEGRYEIIDSNFQFSIGENHYFTFYETFGKNIGYPTSGLLYKYSDAEISEFMQKFKLDIDTSSNQHQYYRYSQLTLIDLIQTLSVFKNNGKRTDLTRIKKIEDKNGQLLYENSISKTAIISDTTAKEMMQLLSYYIDEGIAAKLRWYYKIEGNLAGVISVSSDNKTNWIIMMDDEFTIGIRNTINLEFTTSGHHILRHYIKNAQYRLYLDVKNAVSPKFENDTTIINY